MTALRSAGEGVEALCRDAWNAAVLPLVAVQTGLEYAVFIRSHANAGEYLSCEGRCIEASVMMFSIYGSRVRIHP
jgi:hypothetical protein